MSLFLPLEQEKSKILDTMSSGPSKLNITCKLHKCMDVSLIQSLEKNLLLLPAIRNWSRKLRLESARL